jgi:hypothetical protein
MGFRLIGGASSSGASVPTMPTLTFAADNFGIGRSDITSGGTNSFPTAPGQSLGTLNAAVDGIEFDLRTTSNVYGAIKFYLDGVQKINLPFNTQGGNIAKVRLPIRLAAGALSFGVATNGSGSTGHIGVIPYQSSVAETITTWDVLGSQTNMTDQGVHYTEVTDLNQWKQIAVLGSGPVKAIAAVAFPGGKLSGRTGSNEYVIDLGTGASGAETVLVPKLSASDSTTVLRSEVNGPYRVTIPGLTRVAARIVSEAGTLPDPISLQVAIGY